MYQISVPDMCKVLYDKNQFWYKFWTRHVLNSNEVKDNCFNVPGVSLIQKLFTIITYNSLTFLQTILVHEPFEVEMSFDFPGVAMQGLYKIVIILKAIGPRKIQRNTTICIEIIGDMEPL